MIKLRYTGDVVLQECKDINLEAIKSERLILNLESPIINASHRKIKDKITLFSNEKSLDFIKVLDPYLINLSNNHINDYGVESASYTVEMLEKNELNSFGVGFSNNNNNIKIDHEINLINVSYSNHTSDLTGNILFSSKHFIGPKEVDLKELNELRERYPNYIIVVSIHWGVEDISLPIPYIRELAKSISALDIDVIIGHHPHIIQPYEKIGNTHILYSLGNCFFPDVNFEFKGDVIRKKSLPHQKEGLIVDISYTSRQDLLLKFKKVINTGRVISVIEYDDLDEIDKTYYIKYMCIKAKYIYDLYSNDFFNRVLTKLKPIVLTFLSKYMRDEDYLKLVFKRSLGYPLNMKTPKTLNEKLQWTKLNKVDDLMVQCSDKVMVRNYVQLKIGNEYLIPLIKVFDDPNNIKFEDLPDFPFIIKSNHTSGTYQIIWNKNNVDINSLISKAVAWIDTDYSNLNKEYQYKRIKRKIIIEKLLIDNGEIPSDIKFTCISGKVEIIHVDSNKESVHCRNNYSRNWDPLDFNWPDNQGIPRGKLMDKPKNLNCLIDLAEKLATDFKFVRVDFYTVGDAIYFGELTFHPTSGLGTFSSYDLDLFYGDKL
ncbi:CapA family protein [Vibrio sp.]|nr:CapA family protein [Vibrio sp.]